MMMNDTRDLVVAHQYQRDGEKGRNKIQFPTTTTLSSGQLCTCSSDVYVYTLLNLLTASMMQHIHRSRAKDTINHHSCKWTPLFSVCVYVCKLSSMLTIYFIQHSNMTIITSLYATDSVLTKKNNTFVPVMSTRVQESSTLA
jgi:hypothetical protein